MRARSAATLLLLLSCALGAACQRAPAKPPLVLLISVDTLRRDALHAFAQGAAPLASLDAFAAESVRFDRATSAASWTLPAHGSLLTGLYPDRHGATDPHVALSNEVPTLAERLRAAGFETIALTQGGYLDRKYGMDRGFDRYTDDPPSGGPDHSIFDQAAALVAARKDARPLFLFLQTYSVHDYFLLRPWTVAAIGEKPPRTASEYGACLQGRMRCDPADWQVLRALYDAELQNLDACFGRLRAALVAAGLWDRALVVLTSDHGEGFAPELHRIHHGGRLHEDLVRVPMLVRAPGLTARAIAAPVSLVDVAPTLLAMTGAEPIANADGRSLADLLRGGADPPARTLFAEEHYSTWWADTRTRAVSVQARPLSIAAIDGDHWYLRTADRESVYDLASDPHMEHDLGPGAPFAAALREAAKQRDVDRVATPVLESDEQLRARLRALGYGE